MATRFDTREQFVDHLKRHMPETYKEVQAKASLIGKQAYALAVRGAVKGEANAFWAMEAGYVVGTPVGLGAVMDQVAIALVRFGASFVCVWGQPTDEGQA